MSSNELTSKPLAAIDHVVITVDEELDAAAAVYERLGFSLTERGHHSLGSSNNLAIFGKTYLELLGFEQKKTLDRQWDYPLGLSGLAFKTSKDEDFTAPLIANGAKLGPINSFSRPVSYKGGNGIARFRTAAVEDDLIANGRIFFCQHLTPELVWREEWQTHANGVVDVAEIYVAAKDPRKSLSVYKRLFGSDISSDVDGGVAIPAGQATIYVLQPDAVNAIFKGAEAISEDGSDRFVALGLRTSKISLAKDALSKGSIKFTVAEGRVVVAASEAFGVAISFLE